MADDKRKLSYWQLRAVQSEQKSHDAATKQATIIARAYMRAQNYLTGEVSQIYKRYFTDGKTTESEAQQILNTKVSPTELVTLRALADNINDKESKKQVTNYLSQMAAKGRITRLEELKAKSYIAVKQASSVEIEKSTDLYTKVIQNALDQATSESVIGGFDKDVVLPSVSAASQPKKRTRTILDPKTGKEMVTVKVSPDEPITRFKEVSGKYVKAALDAPFMGKNYSKRIWHNTDQLANRLSELFTAQQMSGMRERDMVQALAKEFGASSYNTRRLIRTEANYFHNQTKLNEWKRRGVKTYQLVAVLDMRTSKICRNIDGRIFNVDEAEVNVNFPPLHPFCRTVAIIYLPDSKYMLPRTANNPRTGKTFKLNPDDNYHDWKHAIDKPALTDEETAALQRYISSDSYKINDALRRGIQLTDNQRNMISNLDTAIDKLPKYDSDKALHRSYFFATQQDFNDFANKLMPGKMYTEKGYFSTSKGDYGEGGEQLKLIINSSSTGHDLKGYNDNEQEVLFGRNTKWKSLDAYVDDDNVPTIVVKEVLNDE